MTVQNDEVWPRSQTEILAASVGPLTLDWPIFDGDSVQVYLDDAPFNAFDLVNVNKFEPSAQVTFTTALTGTVEIRSNVAPARTSTADLTKESTSQEIDRIYANLQQLEQFKVGIAPDGSFVGDDDGTILRQNGSFGPYTWTIGDAGSRAQKSLGFDESGTPTLLDFDTDAFFQADTGSVGTPWKWTIPAAVDRAGKALSFDESGNAVLSPVLEVPEVVDPLHPYYIALERGEFCFTDIAAMDVPAEVEQVQTFGFSTPGDGGSGKYLPLADPVKFLCDVEDAATTPRRWRLNLAGEEYGRASQFGAPFQFGDNINELQGLIDFLLYSFPAGAGTAPGPTALIDGPAAFISRPLILTYGRTGDGSGTDQQAMKLRGLGRKFSADVTVPGTLLTGTMGVTNQALIEIQGARGNTGISNITLDRAYYQLAFPGGKAGLDAALQGNSDGKDLSFWSAYGGLDPYRPAAVIAIDPRSGAQQASDYAIPTWPSFFGAVADDGWNAPFSSAVLFENVEFLDAPVGIATQPCDADGNGDFPVFKNCFYRYMTYAHAVAGNQCRNYRDSDGEYAEIYRVMSNNSIGNTADIGGRFDGIFDNPSVGTFVGGWYDLPDGTPAAGNTIVQNLYAEGMHNLGEINAGSSNETMQSMDSCTISLNGVLGDDAMKPTALIEGDGNAMEITSLSVTNITEGIALCRGANVEQMSIKMLNTNTRRLADGPIAQSDLCWYSTFLGLLPGNGTRHPTIDAVQTRRVTYDKGTGQFAAGASLLHRKGTLYTAVQPIPFWAPEPRLNRMGPKDTWGPCIMNSFTLNKVPAVSVVTLSNGTLTIVQVSADSDDRAHARGLTPGAILVDSLTAMAFKVTSWNAGTIVAKQISGFAGATKNVTESAFTVDSGQFFCFPTGFFVRDSIYLGDFTLSSPTVTNVRREDGFAGSIDANFIVGERLCRNRNSLEDQTGTPFVRDTGEARVTAIDQGAQTLTLAANARATVANVPLVFSQYPVLANE